MNILEANYKKLKQAYGEKNARTNFLDNAEEKEEIIRQKRYERITSKYWKQISKRANIWSIVLEKSKKNKQIENKKLIIWGI